MPQVRAKPRRRWVPAAWANGDQPLDAHTQSKLVEALGLNPRDAADRKRIAAAVKEIAQILGAHHNIVQALNPPGRAEKLAALRPIQEAAQSLFQSIGDVDIETETALTDAGWTPTEDRALEALLLKLSVAAQQAADAMKRMPAAVGRPPDRAGQFTQDRLRAVYTQYADEPADNAQRDEFVGIAIRTLQNSK